MEVSQVLKETRRSQGMQESSKKYVHASSLKHSTSSKKNKVYQANTQNRMQNTSYNSCIVIYYEKLTNDNSLIIH